MIKNSFSKKIHRRYFILGLFKITFLIILSGRLLYLQIFKGRDYKTLANKNRIKVFFLSPERGNIIDRNKEIIATNKKYFRLLLDQTNNNYRKDLEIISEILNFDSDRKSNILEKIKKSDRRFLVTIKENLNWQEISAIEEQKFTLSNIFIDIAQARYYPYSFVSANLIGYLGKIDGKEKNKVNNNDFFVGKTGVEKIYEEKLCGKFGYKEVEVNALGKNIRLLSKIESEKGEDLQLNIDIKLQEKIYPILNPHHSCSAIVMNCRNGEVIILANTPNYDANNFTNLDKNYWHELINNPHKPLLNKAIQNLYPPGSVFKIVTVLAALEAGISPNKNFYCHGQSFIAGYNGFRCWHKEGHGTVNASNAIKYSCNHYMYEIAKIIGGEKILEMAERFGFGSKTSIDLPGEASGFLPSYGWKRKILNNKWSLGDSLNLSIGQGFLLVTPMQLACFAAAIANGGFLYKPSIASGKDSHYKEVKIAKNHIDFIKRAMYLAVNEAGGTAYQSRFNNQNFILAGKTGTSQVKNKASINDDLSRDSVAYKNRNHALFIGFAPYDEPTYAISVFVEHGGGGAKVAAPIAKNILSFII